MQIRRAGKQESRRGLGVSPSQRIEPPPLHPRGQGPVHHHAHHLPHAIIICRITTPRCAPPPQLASYGIGTVSHALRARPMACFRSCSAAREDSYPNLSTASQYSQHALVCPYSLWFLCLPPASRCSLHFALSQCRISSYFGTTCQATYTGAQSLKALKEHSRRSTAVRAHPQPRKGTHREA